MKLCIIGGLTISGHLHARPLGSSADLLLPTWWVVCTVPDSVFERPFFVLCIFVILLSRVGRLQFPGLGTLVFLMILLGFPLRGFWGRFQGTPTFGDPHEEVND